MRVLHVITSLRTGGAEKLLLESIPFYVKEGISVDLLLLNGEDSIFLQSLKQLNICNIYVLGCGSLYNPLFIFKIRSYFKSYDIIHVHLFPTLYWVSLAGYLSSKSTKVVYTEHSTYNKRRSKKWLRPLERIIYRRYNKIICISEKTKNNLNNWLNWSESNKTIVIENGINLNMFISAAAYDKEQLNIPLASKVILMTARFNIQKDPNTLIRAFTKLEEKSSYLIFIGDGVLRQQSELLVEKLNIKDRVLFLGIREDIPELIKMADICVLSSNWEGFGLVAVEYMAASRPAIVSDVDGLKDIVEGAGVIFEKGNDEDLRNKIEILLNNDSEYKRVSDLCCRRSLDFSIEKMVSSYINLYKEVLNEA